MNTNTSAIYQLDSPAEAKLAKEQLQAARQKVSTCALESEVLKDKLLYIMIDLEKASNAYDAKLDELAFAESEVGRWRSILTRSGLCQSSFYMSYYMLNY